MIAISLNQNISCEYICQEIQRSIEKIRQTNSSNNLILTINIKEIAYDDNSIIPKIEYDPNCTT